MHFFFVNAKSKTVQHKNVEIKPRFHFQPSLLKNTLYFFLNFKCRRHYYFKKVAQNIFQQKLRMRRLLEVMALLETNKILAKVAPSSVGCYSTDQQIKRTCTFLLRFTFFNEVFIYFSRYFILSHFLWVLRRFKMLTWCFIQTPAFKNQNQQILYHRRTFDISKFVKIKQ